MFCGLGRECAFSCSLGVPFTCLCKCCMVNFLLYVFCNYKIARVDVMVFFQEKLAVVCIYYHINSYFIFYSFVAVYLQTFCCLFVTV